MAEDRSGEGTRRREDTWAGEDHPQNRLGEDRRRREDTWAGEDTARRHVWRRPASSRRRVGARRHFPKTGRVKTRFIANIRVVVRTRGRAKTGRANTLSVAKTRGRHIERRQPQPREALCFELQGSSVFCMRVRTRPRLETQARFPPPRARVRPPCRTAALDVVANPAPAWRRPKWCPNVALVAHVASGSHVVSADVASNAMGRQNVASWSKVASPDVASKRGVTDPRSVRQPGGVARCGVKTWHQLPM